MRRSEVLAAEAVSCLNKALILLKDIWEEIGITEPQRLERTSTVKKHIQGLLEMMIAEEQSLKLRLEKSVESSRAEIQRLSLELGLPQTQEEPQPLLQAEENLRVCVKALLKERSRRMEELQKLLQQEQELATILGTPCYNIDHTRPPSARQLDELRQHLTNQREEQVQREEQFRTLRDQILVLFSDLDHSPDSGLEKDLVHSDLDEFCLSLQNLDSLSLLLLKLEGQRSDLEEQGRLTQDQIQTLWNRLEIPQPQRDAFNEKVQQQTTAQRVRLLLSEAERLEQMKLSNISSVSSRVRSQISELWDRCFCSEEQRLGFTVFYSDQVSEQVLEALEAELQRLKQFYEDHRPILEGVQKWMDQWELLLELEGKACDPARFVNRGGNLLREERQRTELSKSLPKLERLLQSQISLWEQSHRSTFLVKGIDFLHFVEQQWNLLHQQKEQERTHRHMRKARQTEEDMLYGTSLRTPTKRCCIGSSPRVPTRGPSPRQGLNNTPNRQGLNKTRRNPLSGCSLSTNSSLRSATTQVRTPVRSKPPKPRDQTRTKAGPNQDQTWTKPGLNQDQTKTKAGPTQGSVWAQEQKENRPETLSSVASTYSQFLRDLSESNAQIPNQVLNSTDL